MRADGHVQLHVRDAVASKLPPGMLLEVPAASVRPARKHVHRWPAVGEHFAGTSSRWLLCHAHSLTSPEHCFNAGLKAVFGCNGAIWIGQEDNGSLAVQQVRAASQLARIVQTRVSMGAMLTPADMQLG